MAFSDILNSLFNLGGSQTAAPSAQLKSSSGASGSWGVPVMTPAPAAAPIVAPKVKSPLAPPTQNQPPQPPTMEQYSIPSGPSDEEVNSIYNPLYQSLDAQLAGLPGQKAEDLALIEQQQKTANERVLKQKELTGQDYETAQQDVNQQQESALSAAVRAYNAIKQANISRNGMGSSVGQAIGEIAQGEYFRAQGDLAKETQKEIASLLRQRVQAYQYYDDEINRIDADAKKESNQINKQYLAAELAIQTDRRMLDSEKASRRLDIKQQFEANAAALRNKILESKLAMEQWRAQVDYQVQQGIEYGTNQWAGKISEQFGGGVQEINARPEAYNLGPSRTSGSSASMAYNPYYRKTENDENQFFT